MIHLAALALALAPQQPQADALVVYSAGVEELLADPRDEGLRRVLTMLEDRLGEEAFVQDALTRPFCLRVGGAVDAPRFQLTVKCESEDVARSLVEQSAKLLENETPFGTLASGADAETFWVALGEPRAESFDFGSSALSVYYDGAGAAQLLEPLLDDEDAWKVLGAVGLVGDGAGTSRFDLVFDGDTAVATKRRPVRARDATLTSADLRRVPSTATIAGVFPLAPSGLLDWFDSFETGASERLERDLHDATEVKLRADLFDHLGPIGGFFTSSTTGGSPMSGVLFFEVRAPERVAATLARLVGAMGSSVAPSTFEHAGATCTSLAFPGLPVPAEPCFAVAGGALYVAGNPYALREALDQLSAETSVLDHARVAGVIGERERGAWRSFTFFDGPYYLDRGYAAATQLALLAENMARSEEGLGREIGPLLPALSSLSRHAQPFVGWSRIEGRKVVHRTSFDRSLTSNLVALAGSPVMQGSSLIAAVAIPKLLSARLGANESAAIATLRSTASAQAQFQSAGVVDMDEDGVGEYGFFGEMSAARGLRRPAGMSPYLDPPVLSSSFAPQDDGAGNGVVVRSGYVYQLWLGGAEVNGAVPGVTESMTGRSQPSPAASARYWCCYAWPMKPGQTGNRAFVVNQNGDILFLNEPGRYFGLPGSGGRAPAFDAAYSRRGDLSASLAHGARGTDGAPWQVLGTARSH